MKISDIIIWILFLLSIIMAVWYVIGNSPTFEQAILVFILTILFTWAIKVSEIKTKFDIFINKFNSLEDGFKRLAIDFKEHLKHK